MLPAAEPRPASQFGSRQPERRHRPSPRVSSRAKEGEHIEQKQGQTPQAMTGEPKEIEARPGN